MSETVVIHNPSTHDIWPEESKALAESIQKLNKDFEIKVEDHERKGMGVTRYEVLRIALLGGAFGLGKAFAEEAAKKIADSVVDWARERFKGRKSKSHRPISFSIYGPDGLLKAYVVKNALDEPEDWTLQNQEQIESLAKTKETPPKPSQTCKGEHLCPVCGETKPCAFGLCAVMGDVKCDACLYIEEYGPKAARIINSATAVARMLDDAATRLANYSDVTGDPPWANAAEARTWLNEARGALEDLDNAIGRIRLRLRARAER